MPATDLPMRTASYSYQRRSSFKTSIFITAFLLFILYKIGTNEQEALNESIFTDGIKTVFKPHDSSGGMDEDEDDNDVSTQTKPKEHSHASTTSLTLSTDQSTFDDLFDNLPVRKYPKWNGDFPCYDDMYWGLVYIKIKKCASTTTREINQRIAYRKWQMIYNNTQDDGADEGIDEDINKQNKTHDKRHLGVLRTLGRRACNEFSEHRPAYKMMKRWGKQVKKQPKIFYSFLREPTSRYISQFFYHDVSYRNVSVSLENFQRWAFPKFNQDAPDIEEKYFTNMGGFQFNYVTTKRRYTWPTSPEWAYWNPKEPTVVQNVTLLRSRVQEILDTYSFFGIAERYDESLIAMTFLFDLNIGDVLYWKNRSSGGYDFRFNRCKLLTKSYKTDEMEEYLASEEWKTRIAGDYLLYRAANESLDLTIDKVIGRAAFEERLAEYKKVLALVDEKCQGYESCLSTGTRAPRWQELKNEHYTCTDQVYAEYMKEKNE